MKPITIEPKEIDIIVACLEQSLVFWNDKLESENLPEGFDMETVNSLFDDLFAVFIKFSDAQEDMNDDIESEEESLPDNVLRFPGG
tara:strand:+ start:149 stop:406 length:258 start_codon:yes stop_codon:yes gene_type:complete